MTMPSYLLSKWTKLSHKQSDKSVKPCLTDKPFLGNSLSNLSCILSAITGISSLFFPSDILFREMMGTEEMWPYLLAFSGVPALLQFVALLFFPEAPRHLYIDKGDTEGACKGECTQTFSRQMYRKTFFYRRVRAGRL